MSNPILKAMQIDPERVAENLTGRIRQVVTGDLKKKGAVIGVSGGVDSSVVASLCTRALGKERVVFVFMPDKEVDAQSYEMAKEFADSQGKELIVEDITPQLDAMGCYQKRDDAVRRIFPEYDPDYKVKITLAASVMESDSLNYFNVTIESPTGESKSERIPSAEFLEIVAASNMKQRSRMTVLYYHAERRNYAVAGTGNKDERSLGFFVKYGDGGTDFEPIVHLFKVQIYRLARFLEVPGAILERPPTTDTYSADVSQTDFFFGVDFDLLDPVWYAMEHNIPAATVAESFRLSENQVERIWKDIQRKQRTTAYLRHPATGIEE